MKILIDRKTSRLYILIHNFCNIKFVSELPYIAPYCPIYCVELVKKTGYERKNEKEKRIATKHKLLLTTIKRKQASIVTFSKVIFSNLYIHNYIHSH